MVAGRTLKLRVPALIATWLSAFVDYRPYLDPGERGVVQVLAADRDQAKIILRYTKAFFSKVPMLSRMVERETQFGLELSNSVALEVTTASFRSVRGRTTVAAPAHAVLREAEPVEAKLNKGETHLQAVQRLRTQIANLVNERSRIERSEPTTKEKKAKVASFVKELAAKGTPRIFVGDNRVSAEFGRGVIGELDPSPLEVLSWIDPALVIERLEAVIDAEHKSSNLMSVADRDQRLAEIKLELHEEAERREVQHIRLAANDGQYIEHRANVSIPVLIDLAIGPTPKANAA